MTTTRGPDNEPDRQDTGRAGGATQSGHASQQWLLRFIEEAQVTGQLEPPSTVPIYGRGRPPPGRTVA